jgi:hypothetical protein
MEQDDGVVTQKEVLSFKKKNAKLSKSSLLKQVI